MNSRRLQLQARMSVGVALTAACVLFLASLEERKPSCVVSGSETLVLLFWCLGPLSAVAGASVVSLGLRRCWHPLGVAFTALAIAALLTVLTLVAIAIPAGCLD